MTLQTLIELMANRPFKPFRVVMSSGLGYEVRHSETAFLTRTILFVGIDIKDDGVPAEFKMCSLLHITTIEPLNIPVAGPN
jgi:hypothetical protein